KEKPAFAGFGVRRPEPPLWYERISALWSGPGLSGVKGLAPQRVPGGLPPGTGRAVATVSPRREPRSAVAGVSRLSVVSPGGHPGPMPLPYPNFGRGVGVRAVPKRPGEPAYDACAPEDRRRGLQPPALAVDGDHALDNLLLVMGDLARGAPGGDALGVQRFLDAG